MSRGSSDSGEALAWLLMIVLGIYCLLMAAMALVAVAVVVGVPLLCGVAVNLFIRWLAAMVYRSRPVSPRVLLSSVLASGIPLSLILLLTLIYPGPLFYWAVSFGFFLALAGYYGAHWLIELPYESEAVMRAEEEIVGTQIRMWVHWLWYRVRVACLALVNSLGLMR